jgi:hypothetical protein
MLVSSLTRLKAAAQRVGRSAAFPQRQLLLERHRSVKAKFNEFNSLELF